MVMLTALIASAGLSSCTPYTSAKTPSKTTSSGTLSANLKTVSFGTIGVGKTMTESVTVTNTGTSTVTIDQTAVTGASFTTGAGTSLATIAPGQSKTIQIQFAPQSPGSASGGFTVTSDAVNSPLSVQLVGMGAQSGQAQLGAIPGAAAFGNVSTGNSNSQTITLTNSGTANIVISSSTVTGTGFGVTGLSAPLTIPTGSNVTFNAVFTPSVAGSVTGSISLSSSAPNSPLSIALSGTGVAGTQLLTFSTSSLSFGSVTVGSNSDLSSALTNTGNSSVTISAVDISSAGFTVSGVSSGETLTAGQSVPVSVQFAPTVAGAVSGNVRLISSATNSPATMGLSGSGALQSTHTVGLTWMDSASTVSGYNVYRGTINGGPYVSRLTPSPIPSTQFSDTGLQSGQTYYYVITAVDSNGVESAYSNQGTASIP
jgi:Abnormal spindle-like microcephaly-assoc'd, ASPM-SPD-2-Hydin